MQVKVLKKFFDAKEGCDRTAGEVFEATAERFAEIQAKLPSWVEAVEEEPKPKATRRKTTTTKRK